MFRKLFVAFSVLALLGLLGFVSGCNSNNNTSQLVASSDEPENVAPDCVTLPETLPDGISLIHVKESLKNRSSIAFEELVPEVLQELGDSYAPEDYYIDSLGLHWGHPKRTASELAQGSCYHAYGFSIVGGLHFVYWFHYRPPSYDAFMAWIPIYAQPYDKNGILVQKRDICWICGCNPVCAMLWTWVCAK